jgi:uncharacterized protein with GYD domain
MATYLYHVKYTSDSMKGVLADGGTGRRAAIEALAASVGATVDAVYFSVGSADVTIVAQAPDDTAAAAITAIGMTVVAAGVTDSVEIIPVLTPEELDVATKLSPAYRAPGA